ncbi:hypothetical protein ACHQM5_029364 [Ranunculus cassubicifolius]
MMHMTFYWGKNVTILFDSWKTDSYISYIISLFTLFLFSIFYQYMEDRRLRLKILSTTKNKSSNSSSIETPLLSRFGKNKAVKYATALMFGVNSAVGYFLMLAIMSFNWGVFIAVILGLSLGYLFFRCGDDDEVVVLESPCACA